MNTTRMFDLADKGLVDERTMRTFVDDAKKILDLADSGSANLQNQKELFKEKYGGLKKVKLDYSFFYPRRVKDGTL